MSHKAPVALATGCSVIPSINQPPQRLQHPLITRERLVYTHTQIRAVLRGSELALEPSFLLELLTNFSNYSFRITRNEQFTHLENDEGFRMSY